MASSIIHYLSSLEQINIETSLSLSFPVGKMETTPTSHVEKWNDIITIKSLTLSIVFDKSSRVCFLPLDSNQI